MILALNKLTVGNSRFIACCLQVTLLPRTSFLGTETHPKYQLVNPPSVTDGSHKKKKEKRLQRAGYLRFSRGAGKKNRGNAATCLFKFNGC